MSDTEKKPTARPPIRDAATLIIVRMKGNEPEVLMGERSSGHVFFPHHYAVSYTHLTLPTIYSV